MAGRATVAALAAGLLTASGAEGASTPQPKPSPPPVVVRVSDGFHWGDAGIGAGGALGVVLLAAGVRRAGR